MENKINIAELLKDCPKGMELDCVMFGDVTFEGIKQDEYPIIVKIKEPSMAISLTENGCWNLFSSAKCVIFPKGKTTWEGFVPPCNFKDGDIIYIRAAFEWVAIYKENNSDDIYKYVGVRVLGDVLVNDCCSLCYKGDIREIRHATEEEKQKLFDAIKDNGYKWNAETKTLEKLPRFKVGDRITCIYNNYQYDIKELTDTHYTLVEVEDKFQYTEPISEDKNWKLVSNKFDITTLKPLISTVLIRDYNDKMWMPAFWGKLLEEDSNCRYLTSCGCYKYCIPYEGNEYLLGTTNDCDEYYKTW